MADFRLSATLREARRVSKTALIADVKCRSPRDGQLIAPQGVEVYAKALLDGRVDALAVVTEPKHFGGSLEIARTVRRIAAGLPVIRKEFFERVEQMDESYELGFDAVHLTLRAIGDVDRLERMRRRAEELGMEAVFGIHDQRELEAVLRLGASILGINNRDIGALEMDDGTVGRTEELMPEVPREVLVISESGLSSRGDVVRAAKAGAVGVLIGTALVKSRDPISMVRDLRGETPS